MDERVLLLREYRKETPGDGNAPGKVTFDGRKRVRRGYALEDE